MYHVQMRMRLQSARAFNLSAEQVNERFLAPLRGAAAFMYEGHEWEPRKTRISVYEAPELRPDQLGMGRGWATVEKLGTDVTRQLLARTLGARGPGAGAPEIGPGAAAAPPAALLDQLEQRLIGRLAAGPATAAEILALAAELMPESSAEQRLAAGRAAAWELLRRGNAQLAPSER